MMKRGIGAVVLAVIAALLLAYLLKGKSSERQEVVDMKLPGAPELNIPSLSEAGNTLKTSVEGAADTVTNAGTAVVASATGATNAVVDTAKEVGKKASAIIVSSEEVVKTEENPGFSIRPTQGGEQREIVDNTKEAAKEEVAKVEEKAFKPRIIEEKKKVVKAKPPVAKKVPVAQKPAVAKKAPTPQAKTPAKAATKATTVAAGSGKYAIQLLATSSSSRATKLSNVMKSEGYNTFITETSNNNKVLYRVRVGGYGNRNSALKAQEGMKRRYQKNFFVQNSLVVSR